MFAENENIFMATMQSASPTFRSQPASMPSPPHFTQQSQAIQVQPHSELLPLSLSVLLSCPAPTPHLAPFLLHLFGARSRPSSTLRLAIPPIPAPPTRPYLLAVGAASPSFNRRSSECSPRYAGAEIVLSSSRFLQPKRDRFLQRSIVPPPLRPPSHPRRRMSF